MPPKVAKVAITTFPLPFLSALGAYPNVPEGQCDHYNGWHVTPVPLEQLQRRVELQARRVEKKAMTPGQLLQRDMAHMRQQAVRRAQVLTQVCDFALHALACQPPQAPGPRPLKGRDVAASVAARERKRAKRRKVRKRRPKERVGAAAVVVMVDVAVVMVGAAPGALPYSAAHQPSSSALSGDSPLQNVVAG